jgi:excisionase family DNA binding protein
VVRKGLQVVEEQVKKVRIESLMTARQVAEFLQVNVCTVGRWSRQGRLRFVRVGRRGDMRFRLEDILRFIDASTTRASERSGSDGIRDPRG